MRSNSVRAEKQSVVGSPKDMAFQARQQFQRFDSLNYGSVPFESLAIKSRFQSQAPEMHRSMSAGAQLNSVSPLPFSYDRYGNNLSGNVKRGRSGDLLEYTQSSESQSHGFYTPTQILPRSVSDSGEEDCEGDDSCMQMEMEISFQTLPLNHSTLACSTSSTVEEMWVEDDTAAVIAVDSANGHGLFREAKRLRSGSNDIEIESRNRNENRLGLGHHKHTHDQYSQVVHSQQGVGDVCNDAYIPRDTRDISRGGDRGKPKDIVVRLLNKRELVFRLSEDLNMYMPTPTSMGMNMPMNMNMFQGHTCQNLGLGTDTDTGSGMSLSHFQLSQLSQSQMQSSESVSVSVAQIKNAVEERTGISADTITLVHNRRILTSLDRVSEGSKVVQVLSGHV